MGQAKSVKEGWQGPRSHGPLLALNKCRTRWKRPRGQRGHPSSLCQLSTGVGHNTLHCTAGASAQDVRGLPATSRSPDPKGRAV